MGQTLEELKKAAVSAALEAREAEKSGADEAERKAIFDKHLSDAPHRSNPQAKQVIGGFLADLVNISEGKGAQYTKDLSEGTNSAGGFLTPLEFSGTLIELLYKLPVIRPNCTVLPMSSDKMEVPVEAATVTANWTAELATITQSDMVFSQIVLAVNNLIGISRMSRQLLLDSAINVGLTDLVMQRFAKSIGRVEDSAFMTGSGAGQPKGLRQYTYTHTNVQAGAHLTGDDLITLYHALPYQYRVQGNPVWLFNDLTLAIVRKLKDSQNQYLYQDGYGMAFRTPGGTPNLLGVPVLVQNDIPTNLGVGGTASEVYFGDLNYYVIGDREEIFSEISTQEGTSFAQHRAAVKVGERLDGQLSAVDGFAQLTAVTV
jgi:HK97 family phage major capsid protein